MAIVEIPEGSGNRYRYDYQDGATVYKGPVGDAPFLNEKDFLAAMSRTKRVALTHAKVKKLVEEGHLEPRHDQPEGSYFDDSPYLSTKGDNLFYVGGLEFEQREGEDYWNRRLRGLIEADPDAKITVQNENTGRMYTTTVKRIKFDIHLTQKVIEESGLKL